MKNNFSLITIIKDIIVYKLNIIHNLLFIGICDGIYLINLKNYKLTYHFENDIYINYIIPLKNGNILISCYIEKKNNDSDNNSEDLKVYFI